MGSIAALKASQIHLSPENLGLARLDLNPSGCLELANELLQKNHEKFHMYFRNVAGHNHIPHSILTVLAMGGGPKELNRAYTDAEGLQRPLPPVDPKVVKDLSDPERFKARMLELPEYPNFLAFFEQEIEAKGSKAVTEEYLFSHTPLAEQMLAQLYEGLYHPIIHLGFAVEFDQPSIIAESLAQAASHDPGQIDEFFQRSELLARSGSVKPKPLIELYAEFQVKPEDLERGTAEMMSCAAFTAAAQKPGKAFKIDFFYLHIVTCSIAVDVLLRQTWIKIEDKVRLLEWKGRLDLVWYAANGSAELRIQDLLEYEPTLSSGMDWRALYKVANNVTDDGHVVKYIRSLKNAQDVARPFEQGEGASYFPVKGDLYLKIAQICYDSTAKVIDEDPNTLSKKWVWGAGYDMAWGNIPDIGINRTNRLGKAT
ncbi:hypothetical protein B0O99DRAFT_660544 [Bisporella sp. PMI_857]|nr:hypothetical protein B0O99DRAFT_660544 [Bisporella sp. PMI_857]